MFPMEVLLLPLPFLLPLLLFFLVRRKGKDKKEYEGIERLDQGFAHFKRKQYRKHPEKFMELERGQNPKFMVFACSDSRVSPSHVLNFKPGEAFMVRNIANMVPPSDLSEGIGVGAALEYAVVHLKVKNIVVMGHSRCGSIQALMGIHGDNNSNPSFVEEWIKICERANEKVTEEETQEPLLEQCATCEMESIMISLENLLTYPFVKEALGEGNLSIFGAYYDFVACELRAWTFQP